jgi:hypothetical protein
VLGGVLNLFDVYVQYANSEGFGMPMVEAAACGVPVMAVDYSAMSDVVRKVNGFPIKVQRLLREAETHCLRAVPDNDDLVKQLIAFLSLPDSMRARKGFLSRKGMETNYSYDKTAQIWADYIDSVVPKDTWAFPAHVHEPQLSVPRGLSNEQFVAWGIRNIAGRPELLNSYMAVRMCRDLYMGMTVPHTGGLYINELSNIGTMAQRGPFNHEIAVQELVKIAEVWNRWETKRAQVVK